MFRPSQRLLKIFLLVLLTMAFYTLARVEFLVWNWKLFQNKTVWDILLAFTVGLRFDLSASLSLIAPLLLFTFIPWPESWERFWRVTVGVFYILIPVSYTHLTLPTICSV